MTARGELLQALAHFRLEIDGFDTGESTVKSIDASEENVVNLALSLIAAAQAQARAETEREIVEWLRNRADECEEIDAQEGMSTNEPWIIRRLADEIENKSSPEEQLDLLRPLTSEEAAKVQPLSKETIDEAMEEGRKNMEALRRQEKPGGRW